MRHASGPRGGVVAELTPFGFVVGTSLLHRLDAHRIRLVIQFVFILFRLSQRQLRRSNSRLKLFLPFEDQQHIIRIHLVAFGDIDCFHFSGGCQCDHRFCRRNHNSGSGYIPHKRNLFLNAWGCTRFTIKHNCWERCRTRFTQTVTTRQQDENQ